ncbi:alpha/beta fold hydrolase, partial [Streptomonospora alba]|uniref:alpha/beta fold hydrolase n=1 Tax=Streptomonospora alba TaxID=183763 RepID=UPI00193113DF
FLHGKIRGKVHDPGVAEQLLPRGYPLGGKRICVDTGYYEAFNRDDVHLIDIKDTPIDAVTPRGPLVDGVEYPVDVIVFATGFDAMTGALSRIEVRGRGGAALSEKWAAGPTSYLGLAVSGFPNLFLVTGPGSPSVFGNVIVSIEHDVDWITEAVVHLRERDLALMEATQDAEDAWVQHVGQVADSTLLADVGSWYTGANVPGKPRVFMGYAGGAGEFRRRCEKVARQGYTGFSLRPEPPRSRPFGDGTRLEITETGTGTPLVLVCGNSQDHRLWAPLLPALACRHRVITYNHRGIGGSERGGRAITMADLADDLADLLRGLGAAPSHVLGWSLGSAVVQEFALRHPDLVTSLILCGTWGRTDAFQRPLVTALAHPWHTGHRDRALTALGITYSRELLDSEELGPLMAQLDPLFPSTDEELATVAEQWDADLAHDSLDRLGGIAAPTLVVAGEKDLLTPAYQGRLVAETIATASFELFTGPGSSHALLMERPEEFADLVLKFLTDPPLT